ncbi:MAG: hypothetical protein OHK005_12490 [Candidatus Methylacidiphilales bacterium]
MNVDVLVVGQGLAGTQVAWALRGRGLRVLVVDAGHREAASWVAAGVLNPVTGQRLVLSWQADQHLPFAKETYRQQERWLGKSFLREMAIQRVIRSESERTRWERRRLDSAYGSFLGPFYPPGSFGAIRDEPFGSCSILGAAVLDTKCFLQSVRKRWMEEGILREDRVEYGEVVLKQAGVQWRDVRADRIVFCQGWAGRHHPEFGHLPFQWAKGEIVGLRVPHHGLDRVINREKWVLPEDNERVRVGSTFCWETLNDVPTSEAARDLVRAVRAMVTGSVVAEVIGHEAGVRPCSHDQRPYVGRSRKDERVWIANGFGAKGALTTPLCARRLAAAMVGEGELDPGEDVARVARSLAGSVG